MLKGPEDLLALRDSGIGWLVIGLLKMDRSR